MALKEVKRTIGEKVIIERKRKNWSQSQLAEIAGVGEKVIGQIENFKGNPTLETIDKIAKAFRKDIDDFLPDKKGIITINFKALEKFKKGE